MRKAYQAPINAAIVEAINADHSAPMPELECRATVIGVTGAATGTTAGSSAEVVGGTAAAAECAGEVIEALTSKATMVDAIGELGVVVGGPMVGGPAVDGRLDRGVGSATATGADGAAALTSECGGTVPEVWRIRGRGRGLRSVPAGIDAIAGGSGVTGADPAGAVGVVVLAGGSLVGASPTGGSVAGGSALVGGSLELGVLVVGALRGTLVIGGLVVGGLVVGVLATVVLLASTSSSHSVVRRSCT